MVSKLVKSLTKRTTTSNKVSYNHDKYIFFENTGSTRVVSMNVPLKTIYDEKNDVNIQVYDLENTYIYAPSDIDYVKPISGILQKIDDYLYYFETVRGFSDGNVGGDSFTSIRLKVGTYMNELPEIHFTWEYEADLKE